MHTCIYLYDFIEWGEVKVKCVVAVHTDRRSLWCVQVYTTTAVAAAIIIVCGDLHTTGRASSRVLSLHSCVHTCNIYIYSILQVYAFSVLLPTFVPTLTAFVCFRYALIQKDTYPCTDKNHIYDEYLQSIHYLTCDRRWSRIYTINAITEQTT